MEKIPLTSAGFKKLDQELKHLKSVERPAVIRAIAEAREHGDLSENAEYHAAREQQSHIEGRIKELEGIIGRADVIDVSKLSGAIKFGAQVTVVDEDTEEEKRYQKALEKARDEIEQAVGAKHEKLRHKIDELQRRLEEAHANKERAISRAQLTRSGHVYVISNIGSFGENVYKIGMTRRLEPLDRVRELGDASVPFRFDVHAIIYSEDAPSLENQLHNIFNHRRVNRVNSRKEFFKVTLDEIAEVVREHHGEIEFIKVPEAEEYRKTMALLKKQEEARQRTEDRKYKALEVIDQLLQN